MISGPSHVKATLSKPQVRSSKTTFLPVDPVTSLHILSCRFILSALFILWRFACKVFEIFIQISPFGEVIYLNWTSLDLTDFEAICLEIKCSNYTEVVKPLLLVGMIEIYLHLLLEGWKYNTRQCQTQSALWCYATAGRVCVRASGEVSFIHGSVCLTVHVHVAEVGDHAG